MDVPGAKLRALLAVLLFHAGEPVPAATLRQALWGDRPPASATASLQNHVARLRRLLEAAEPPGPAGPPGSPGPPGPPGPGDPGDPGDPAGAGSSSGGDETTGIGIGSGIGVGIETRMGAGTRAGTRTGPGAGTATGGISTRISTAEEPPGARHPARIDAVGSAYRIRVAEGELDAAVFTRLAGYARQAHQADDWPAVGRWTTEALVLWRGTPVSDTPVDLLGPAVRELVEIRLETLEWYFDAALRLGRHEGLVSRLTKATGEHPLREGLHVQLMEALHRSGGRAEALEVFRRLRRALVDELGIEPSAVARETQRRILAADGDAPSVPLPPTAQADPEPAHQGPAITVPERAPEPSTRTTDVPDPASDGEAASVTAVTAVAAAVATAAAAGTVTASTAPAPTPADDPDQPPPTPANLPRDITGFTGRDAETAGLLDAVATAAAHRSSPGATAPIFSIDGMPGVGKSAFAVHLAHRLAPEFPDGQLHLALQGHTPGAQPMNAADAAAALLLQVGVPPERIPADPAARAGLWRARLAGKRMLLLLDDVANSDQVRPLLPGFGAGGCLVLLTSRRRLMALDDAVPVTLDVLSADDAARLFAVRAARAGVGADDPGVREVVRLCGRLPLAVHLMASRLRHYPVWQTADLVADLAEANRRMTALSAEDVSVSAVFACSYRDLAPERQRLFRLLGLPPGDDIEPYAAAALSGVEPAQAWLALRDLEERHLVEEPVRGRYRMHDLLREHARSLATVDELETRESAVRRLLHHYLATAVAADRLLAPGGHADRPRLLERLSVDRRARGAVPLRDEAEAVAWFTAESANVLALTEAAASEHPAEIVALATAFYEFLRGRSQWGPAWTLNRLALAAARRTRDVRGEAATLLRGGVLQRYLGAFRDGEKDLMQAWEMYRTMDEPAAQAWALAEVGDVRRVLGEYAAAEADLREAHALYERLGDRIGQAQTLVTRAHIQQMLGEYAAATENLGTALLLYREVGHRRGQANALAHLGDLNQSMGRYGDAEEMHLQALGLFRAIDSRLGQANALIDMAYVQRLTGRYAAAAEALTSALELLHTDTMPLGTANALFQLACVRLATGDATAAAALLTESLALCRAMGSRPGEAHVLLHRGAVDRKLGKLDEARSHMVEALSLFTALDDRAGQAEAHNMIGFLADDRGDPGEARAHHESALEIAKAIGAPLEEARALEGIGVSHWRQGRADLARPGLAESLAIHRRLRDAETGRVERRLLDVG
ncbi:AfsR/SARP family transcriptional regulator [Catenulispora yoronensis]|uniref:AfsR/SARP family transcriptional regulator n=1 Tax=Catenulispora yoronensis TaxID=450799 RepID=UPI0031D45AD3